MMNYSQEILFKFFFFVNSQWLIMNLSMNSTSDLNDFLQKSIHLLIICEYRVWPLDLVFDLTSNRRIRIKISFEHLSFSEENIRSIVDMIDDHLENEFNQPEVYSRVYTFDKFISSIEYLPDDLLVNK